LAAWYLPGGPVSALERPGGPGSQLVSLSGIGGKKEASHMSANKGASCSDGCETCPIASATSSASGPFQGTSLGLVSLGYFIFPIVSALLASLPFRGDLNRQALAGIAGLFVGVLLTVTIARRWTKRYEQKRVALRRARSRQLGGCE
jgi:hypothetical protein